MLNRVAYREKRWAARFFVAQIPERLYNEEKMSPASIGGGKAQITGGEHISRLVETPTEVVLPVAKPERRRYNKFLCAKDFGMYVYDNKCSF